MGNCEVIAGEAAVQSSVACPYKNVPAMLTTPGAGQTHQNNLNRQDAKIAKKKDKDSTQRRKDAKAQRK